jgi:FAD/FMN-containing dehydrogenase
MGYLTPRHGLVIDNLLQVIRPNASFCLTVHLTLPGTVQVTIVVADGTKLVANKDENADLYWGCRGGGGNFGVVTEFVYQLHPQRRTVYSGLLIYPPSALEVIANHVDKGFHGKPSDNEACYYVLMRGMDHNVGLLSPRHSHWF